MQDDSKTSGVSRHAKRCPLSSRPGTRGFSSKTTDQMEAELARCSRHALKFLVAAIRELRSKEPPQSDQ